MASDMKETKLFDVKILENKISGVTEQGANVTRDIVHKVSDDLFKTHDFLFRVVKKSKSVLPVTPSEPATK